jgi:hypothetical protein
MMAFAAVIASSSDAWAGTMIGGFLLGGQTCTFQRPASPLGPNMSSAYPWYLAYFVGIGVPPRHKIGCNIVTTTRAHDGDSVGEERNVSVDAA